MTSRAVKRRLAQDVALWQADGLVSDAAAAVLRERYDVQGFGLAVLAKTLGIVGAILGGFGMLGLLAVATGSMAVAALELVAVAAGFLVWGLHWARDPRGRYAHSARALLAIGVLALGGAGAAAATAAGAEWKVTVLLCGLTSVPISFVLAYRFRTGFLLVLGLLGLFHWIGSWSSMVGESTYELDIQDLRVMSLAAAAAVAIGILQRRGKLPGPARFDAAWLSVGLVYLNLSLLFLTVEHGGRPWVPVAFAAALAQIVLGAREKSALVLGFGVTALCVNLFTRYFETFWDGLDKGIFFLVGGVLLFGFGVLCERLARRVDLRPAAEEVSP
jgi:hypothetical protein